MNNKNLFNLKAAVVGLGVGMHHANFYYNNEDTSLKYVLDFDKSKIEQAKKKFPNVKVAANYDEIIADNEIDIISIASYDDAHFFQVMKALKSKKNVFVEKPLCQHKEQLDKIISLYNSDKNLILASNFPLRTTPRFINLKKQIKNNHFGEILSLDLCYFWGRPEKVLNGWRLNMETYSLIQGAVIHMLDLAHFLLEEWPKEITSIGSNKGIKSLSSGKLRNDVDDHIIVLCKYSDGKIAQISAQSLVCHPHFHALKLFGTKKSYISSIKDSFYIDDYNENIITNKNCNAEYPAKEYRYQSLEKFVQSIKNNDKSLLLHNDVFDLMRLVFKCEESLKRSNFFIENK